MGTLEDVRGRLRDAGLDGAVLSDPGATIRLLRGAEPTLPSSGHPLDAISLHDLPTISVDLRGTLPKSAGGSFVASAGRDLEVRSVLGEGGMGRVFLARQRSLQRDVAIKTLRDRASVRDEQALLAEGVVTGHLEHPSIVPVHALGVDHEGRPVLVMKRVEGVEWADLIGDSEHPAWEYWGGDPADHLDGNLQILMQVASAVHFAHTRGILHRDIKPQNVLIGRFGDIYLADWGLAFRMREGEVSNPVLCGTPGYMAPEMALGRPIDERTDVYLLGSTLHEILTGELRHMGKGCAEAVASAVVSAPFEYRETVPEDLARLANQATAASPADRPPSAAAFRRAIVDHREHKGSVALARLAIVRLEALRAAFSAKEGDVGEDFQRDIDRLVTETRFGLRQAIAEWRDNTTAQRALDELERLLESRRARATKLEHMARDLDPTTGSKQRIAAAGLVASIAVGLSVLALQGGASQPSASALAKESLVPLAAVTLLVTVLRKRLLGTAFNRRTMAALFTITFAITVGRLLGARAGLSGPAVLMYDLLIVAAVSAVSAVTQLPQMGFVAAASLAAAIAAGLYPQYAYALFSMTSGPGMLFLLYLTWRPGAARSAKKKQAAERAS